jgi:aryl-alcohol dehydrogenase-like predicted oxidoreductase
MIKRLATAKGCTPSQRAPAWVLAQGPDIVPISGTKRLRFPDDNLGAVNVRPTPVELAQIDSILPVGVASGDRYPAMKAIDK